MSINILHTPNARAETCPSCAAALAEGDQKLQAVDLRRTVGSWLAQAGNDLHLIGKVLNHSTLATSAVYARFSQDVVHQALEEHGQRLMAAAGKQRAE